MPVAGENSSLDRRLGFPERFTKMLLADRAPRSGKLTEVKGRTCNPEVYFELDM